MVAGSSNSNNSNSTQSPRASYSRTSPIMPSIPPPPAQPPRRASSSMSLNTRRKSNSGGSTTLGRTINAALGNGDDNTTATSPTSYSSSSSCGQEEHDDDYEDEDHATGNNNRTRTTRSRSKSQHDHDGMDKDDDDDDYREESFSGPMHYLPLIVAVVPPLGAVLHGRAEAWTDLLILLLVAFYLYQIVRVPWEIYYASRTRRINAASIALTAEEEESLVPEAIKARRRVARAELLQNELFALLFCLISPFLGSYLLYWVRGALSDPDRFINPFNIKLFIMASGVKPWGHFFKLVKNRSLFLQSEVNYPVSTVSILLDQVRHLKSEMSLLKLRFATKDDVKILRDGVDLPLTSLTKAIKRYERKEEYLRLSTEEKFEMLHKRQEELLDELIIANHTIESLRSDQEKSSSLLRALRYVFSGEGVAAMSASRARGVATPVPESRRIWYERGPLFYMFLPLIASNRVMDATGRLFESLTKRIGPLERGGMLEDGSTSTRYTTTNRVAVANH